MEVVDVATLHRDTSCPCFRPTRADPAFAFSPTSVTFLFVVYIILSLFSTERFLGSFYSFTVRIHMHAYTPRTLELFFLLPFLSHLLPPFPSCFFFTQRQ